MPRTFPSLVASVAIALLLTTGRSAASAQTAADLFDANTLQEIRILMNTVDLAGLREHYADNTKFVADMIWRNQRVRNVSVRSRGYGSRNPTKIGLTISFDHYTDDQRFLGLSSLVLKNQYQDPGMVRDRVAMAFYNRMGMPAPRESFARVYVNNEYWGVYGVVEDLTADFLTRAFGEKAAVAAQGERGDPTNGFLFEFHWDPITYWHGEFLGDGLPVYKPYFEPVTHDLDSDTTLYAPVRDLFREVNAPDDGVWRDRVEQVIDLQYFVRFVAIEVYLSEWDGMTGNWGMNNFFLYRPYGSPRHQFIPWDRDHSILQTDGQMPIFQRVFDNVIFNRAMAFADLRSLYLDTLELCANAALQDDWFYAETLRSAQVINAAAHEDTKKFFSNGDFDAEVENLLNFARQRPGYVIQEVPKARSWAQ